jgi:hypothetical protein
MNINYKAILLLSDMDIYIYIYMFVVSSGNYNFLGMILNILKTKFLRNIT